MGRSSRESPPSQVFIWTLLIFQSWQGINIYFKPSVVQIEHITGMDRTMCYHFQPTPGLILYVEINTKLNFWKQQMLLIAAPMFLDQIILVLQNAMQASLLMGSFTKYDPLSPTPPSFHPLCHFLSPSLHQNWSSHDPQWLLTLQPSYLHSRQQDTKKGGRIWPRRLLQWLFLDIIHTTAIYSPWFFHRKRRIDAGGKLGLWPS